MQQDHSFLLGLNGPLLMLSHADAGVLGSTRVDLRQIRHPTPPAAAPTDAGQTDAEAAAASAPALPAFNEAEKDMARRLHAQVC